MMRKWFQHSEVPAGVKRLMLSFYLYKIFGAYILRIIAFFVSLGAFSSEKDRRESSFLYFKILEKYTNKKYPVLISSFRQFLNYGNSLVDRIISFSGHMSAEKFHFKDDGDEIYKCLKEKRGAFFLTTHIGNIEILRSALESKENLVPTKINVFMEKRSCETFNGFLEQVKAKTDNVTSYAVEETGISTAIELSEKLKNGEFAFMAGDRIPINNPGKYYIAKLLDKDIKLPIGALKFAQVLNSEIFFIVCAKEGSCYNVHVQKFLPESENKKEIFEQLKTQYAEFLEKYTIKYPYQFFNFYKIFDNNVN